MEKAFFLDRLQEGLRPMALPLPPPQTLEALFLYQSILLKWNKTLNLTAHRTTDAMIERNFLDCLALTPHLSHLNKIMDLGSGAGFPGVVIKLLWPEVKMTLVEADQRKASFLATLIRELNLSLIETLNVYMDQRKAQELGFQDTFDGFVSRATIPYSKILPLAGLCLKKGGKFFGMLIDQEGRKDVEGLNFFQFDKEIDYILPFSKASRKIKILRKI